MPTPDVVVLVPGFLGFARLGNFYYFADRLISVLRGLLEEPLGYAVPVVPCTTLPTYGLSERQRHLVAYLGKLGTEKLTGVERIHLVGHSTGGVDAQLLACTQSLEGRAWAEWTNQVRKRIKSVVTIAAPHYGTSLADSRLARWGENPLRHPTALLPEVTTFLDILWLLRLEVPALAQLQGAHPREMFKFMMQMALHHELIGDLRPANMEKLRSTLQPEPGVAMTCFVTAVEPREDGDRPSEPFFNDLYRLTQGSDDRKASPAVEGCKRLLQDLLKSNPDLVIRSDRSRMPASIDLGLNDGVVNTVRQVVDPNDASQVGGFVVADHADVIGHYDRQDALIGGKPYNAGLFHSGAAFGDDEFFALYRRVAHAILKTIPSAHREEEAELDVLSIQPG